MITAQYSDRLKVCQLMLVYISCNCLMLILSIKVVFQRCVPTVIRVHHESSSGLNCSPCGRGTLRASSAPEQAAAVRSFALLLPGSMPSRASSLQDRSLDHDSNNVQVCQPMLKPTRRVLLYLWWQMLMAWCKLYTQVRQMHNITSSLNEGHSIT